MFLYPSIIMEVGQDKGPWKTILWLEPDLNSIHVCWIQGVCPPQEIQCHTTTQSWRFKSEESLKRRGTSLTPSQVFDVWPSEKSEAPASYYILLLFLKDLNPRAIQMGFTRTVGLLCPNRFRGALRRLQHELSELQSSLDLNGALELKGSAWTLLL